MVPGCFPGCLDGGGPCTYDSIPGTAIITFVEPATGYADCTNDPVDVWFDFIAEDGEVFHKGSLYLGDSNISTPPRVWVESEGLIVGSKHPAILRRETSGSCTPMIYTLTDIDEDGASASCFSTSDGGAGGGGGAGGAGGAGGGEPCSTSCADSFFLGLPAICSDDTGSLALYDALETCVCGDASAPGACNDTNADPPNTSCATNLCSGTAPDDDCWNCLNGSLVSGSACYNEADACASDF